MLSETEFDSLAAQTLDDLLNGLEPLEGEIDVELAGGILQIDFAQGPCFLINSHRAARQIWMAAARKAWHFDWDPASATWLDSKSGMELVLALEGSLTNKLQRPVVLKK